MKKIKIKFSGFWPGFDYKTWTIYKILSELYDVEVCEDADYVFCSCFGDNASYRSFYEYCKYPQVRIMYSGENYVPDFNFADYGISVYPIEFSDRHLSLPLFDYCNVNQLNIDRNYDENAIKQKEFFANFIASHESENSIRGDFFKKLCEYKRVESPGTYLKNTEVVPAINHLDGSKVAFQKKCKFTLCFESTKHYGFVTEKIRDAFLADTIPVYYGSETVKDIFNPNAFIDVSDYETFDDAIAKIIELDNDNDAYLQMLRQPIFNDKDYIKNKRDELCDFLRNVFDQPLDKAYRRSRIYRAEYHEKYINSLNSLNKDYEENSLIYKMYSGREILCLLWNLLLKRLHLRK